MKAFSFLRHLWRAQSSYRLHSPFVFDFYRQVLRGKASAVGAQIEALRRELARSGKLLAFEDLGAGSSGSGGGMVQRRLGQLARTSARRRAEGEFLHRLCRHYQPRTCLELGTNLGISMLYQLSALHNSRFISLEGAEPLLQLAREHARRFGLQPELVAGDFDHSLDQLDLHTLQPDYAFIDGNHRYEPTLRYFHRLLPAMADGSIMVFDDIYWSAGMARAWKAICAHPQVSVSIDLFSLGVCFIRRKQAKQHFHFLL
ncbi:MAG: class I SAM-dependent methyltransferase [Bacteroidetes bacterium]|nr:MAG: class I SAM-dependent methyltransferase [Bacteroidota bacterium]